MVSQKVIDLLIAQQTANAETQGSSVRTPRRQNSSKAVGTATGMQSKVVDRANYSLLIGAVDILDISNANGIVEEFLIKSPSSDFSIILKVDDTEEYQRTWTELSALSDDVNSVTASLQDGSYILNMGDIHFNTHVKITVSGRGIKFNRLYARAKYAKHD